MHNGCTTAFEATISKKPLLTYLPYEQKYGNELPNRLGYIVKTPEELLNKINEIFFDTHENSKNNSNNLIVGSGLEVSQDVSNCILLGNNGSASVGELLNVFSNPAINSPNACKLVLTPLITAREIVLPNSSTFDPPVSVAVNESLKSSINCVNAGDKLATT